MDKKELQQLIESTVNDTLQELGGGAAAAGGVAAARRQRTPKQIAQLKAIRAERLKRLDRIEAFDKVRPWVLKNREELEQFDTEEIMDKFIAAHNLYKISNRDEELQPGIRDYINIALRRPREK